MNLKSLLEKEVQNDLYRVEPDTIARLNPLFTGQTRPILLNFLQELCFGVGYQRETFYLAMHYMDWALTLTPIKLEDAQLLSITCLSLACKIEEIQLCSTKSFSRYTKNHCSEERIVQMERRLTNLFKFRLAPTTLYFWQQYFCMEWDSLVEATLQSEASSFVRFKFMDTTAEREGAILSAIHPFPCFNQSEPNRWREVTQVLDLISLDMEYARFPKLRLILALTICALLKSHDMLNIPPGKVNKSRLTNVNLALQRAFATLDEYPLKAKILDYCTTILEPRLGPISAFEEPFFGLNEEIKFVA